jgi:hypothetical protein
MHFIEIYKDGVIRSAGLAPYLDYTVPVPEEYPLIKQLLAAKAWWGQNAETLARDFAVRSLMPYHLKEVSERRIAYVKKVEQEVKNRLNAEIAYWDAQAGIMSDQIAQGKPNAKLNADRFMERVSTLEQRLKQRLEELALERNISSKPPTVLGGAWIIPRTMLLDANSTGNTVSSNSSAEGRKEIEQIGMDTIMALEQKLNNIPRDVSKENIGYDIESKTPNSTLRFIEVKGRQAGMDEVSVTHNEMKTAANSPDKYILAVVIVDGNKRHVTYFMNWIDAGPSFAESKRQLNLQRLRKSARIVFERVIEVRG